MPNMVTVLKEEMSRIARKEVRAETASLKKGSAQYRSEIAALKKRVSVLEHCLKRLEKSAGKAPASGTTPMGEAPLRVRFSAKGLQTQRQRLGLSAAAAGQLIGVSTQTIYNWESGTTRPREQQIVAIAVLRTLSKQAAAERLAGAAEAAP